MSNNHYRCLTIIIDIGCLRRLRSLCRPCRRLSRLRRLSHLRHRLSRRRRLARGRALLPLRWWGPFPPQGRPGLAALGRVSQQRVEEPIEQRLAAKGRRLNPLVFFKVFSSGRLTSATIFRTFNPWLYRPVMA